MYQTVCQWDSFLFACLFSYLSVLFAVLYLTGSFCYKSSVSRREVDTDSESDTEESLEMLKNVKLEHINFENLKNQMREGDFFFLRPKTGVAAETGLGLNPFTGRVTCLVEKNGSFGLAFERVFGGNLYISESGVWHVFEETLHGDIRKLLPGLTDSKLDSMADHCTSPCSRDDKTCANCTDTILEVLLSHFEDV